MSERIKFDVPTMGLLCRLANSVGPDGTLYHEIESAFKDSVYELDKLRAEIGQLKSRLADAEKRGMEKAALIAENAPGYRGEPWNPGIFGNDRIPHVMRDHIAAQIRAEIAKMEGKP